MTHCKGQTYEATATAHFSAVPQTLHTQIEIAKAIRTLAGPDQDELLRQRRAEIAAIRRELEALPGEIRKAGEECLALAKVELQAALKKYSPDQPRVPAGNPDGGQWTSESKGGDGASSLETRSRYASLKNPPSGTRTDAMGGAGQASSERAQDPLNLRSLRDALATTLLSYLGQKFNIIRAYEILPDDPRHPVQFLDSSGRPILDDQNHPILRPDDLPPEKYAEAGAASHLADYIAAWKSQMNEPDTRSESVMAGLAVKIAQELAPFLHSGALDAERFGWNYVLDYRHYTSIATGIFMAAAGVSREDALAIADAYASALSRFHSDESMDEFYPYSARRDVEDNLRGYDLYESGRIRRRQ
jgi:hypothetical protein